MNWLIAGVAAFVGSHLLSAALPAARSSIIASIGEKAYRAAFAIVSLAGVVMIVIGWRSALPIVVYAPPDWGYTAAFLLMLPAMYLFAASHGRMRIKRLIRHPQLSFIVLWSAAHLLANGDRRSLVLFGSLGIWAIVEIALLNRRDGEWTRPPVPPLRGEIIGAAITVVAFAVLVALHPYFAGVSPLPR